MKVSEAEISQYQTLVYSDRRFISISNICEDSNEPQNSEDNCTEHETRFLCSKEEAAFHNLIEFNVDTVYDPVDLQSCVSEFSTMRQS